MLTSQITDLKQQISENISNLSKTKKNLIEIKSNGKNLDNNLYLTVQNVKNIESPYKCKVVVKVICDGRELVTEPRSLNDLVWDTSYTVPVSTGQGSIVLQVCSWEFGKIRNVLYELSIPFCALAKQELHEDALPLNPVEQGRNSNACLALAIQWIYDLNVYLEGMVKDYEDAIKEDKNQLEILKNFWNELKAPTDAFGLPDWIKQNQELAQVERVVSSKVQSFFEKVEFFQDREISGRTVKWEKVVTFCLTCFGIISLFNCFQQPAFFNVLVN
jgi:archaellum component FlaF (FlaF/FlaG flagellin family)